MNNVFDIQTGKPVPSSSSHEEAGDSFLAKVKGTFVAEIIDFNDPSAAADCITVIRLAKLIASSRETNKQPDNL